VHVWQIRIPDAPENSHPSPLTQDEQKTAASFLSERDQAQYRYCRATLRKLLGAYLGTPPETLRFEYGSHGKPSLAEPHSKLHFNASHSRDWLLCAVASASAVGIDIETIRPDVNCEAMAARILTADEHAAFRKLSQEEKVNSIFKAWTRKEAYVKESGSGIFFPFDSIVCALHAQDVEGNWHPCGDHERQRHVCSLAAPANYAAALVADVSIRRVIYLDATNLSKISACE
jgi:4'-phosphopantetheinyl transferase